ncbi:MAG: hypothetical protein COA96_16750 [SAR86 cluster bacterium]|uniref:Uncharacterized protein n=1 Tax=SAR86 cluster bacterium TaxID=2030880 RepID=A0A2A5AG96_9GAMM|nr:MAG: hypothetical protein COA96_16750 [SAR86 cluster bacterium]
MTQVTPSQYAEGLSATPPTGYPVYPRLWRWHDNVMRPTWIGGINITTAWSTSVVGALTESEQRIGLRGRPNRIVEWPLQSMEIRTATALQNMMLHAAQTRVLMPVWPDMTTAETDIVSDADFSCDTTRRRFFTGGHALAYSPNNSPGLDTSRSGIINTVTDNELNITLASGTYPAGWRVIPCIEAELSPSLSSVLQTDRHVSGSLIGVESAGASALPALWAPGTTPTGYDEYDGIPVLNLPVRTPIQSGWNVSRAGSNHAVGLGRIGQFYGSRARVSIPLPLQFLNRAAAWRFLQFFDSRAGRVYPFWLVDPVADWELSGLSTTVLLVKNNGMVLDDLTVRPYVGVWLKDGTLYIRGASFTANVPGTGVIIGLDSPIPVVALDQVARVATVYRCRFASDELTERWTTTEHMTTDVEVIELLEEKSVTISNIVDITTAALDNPFDALLCEGEPVDPPTPIPGDCDTTVINEHPQSPSDTIPFSTYCLANYPVNTIGAALSPSIPSPWMLHRFVPYFPTTWTLCQLWVATSRRRANDPDSLNGHGPGGPDMTIGGRSIWGALTGAKLIEFPALSGTFVWQLQFTSADGQTPGSPGPDGDIWIGHKTTGSTPKGVYTRVSGADTGTGTITIVDGVADVDSVQGSCNYTYGGIGSWICHVDLLGPFCVDTGAPAL